MKADVVQMVVQGCPVVEALSALRTDEWRRGVVDALVGRQRATGWCHVSADGALEQGVEGLVGADEVVAH